MTVGDLSTLADALAAATGGAVSVMDPAGYVMAYSSVPGQPIDDVRRDGILGKRVPDHYLIHHRDTDRPSGTVRTVDVPGTLPRLAVAVGTGTEHLGSIWSIVPDGPVDPAAVVAMERGADAAVPLILACRSPSRHSRTHALLTDPDAAGDTDTEYLVLAAEVTSTHRRECLDRLVGLLDLTLARGQDSGCIIVGGTVFLLRPFDFESSSLDDVAAEAEVVRARAASSLGVPITFGIGRPSPRPTVARRQACAVLDVVFDRTATYRQVEVHVQLHRIATSLEGSPMSLPAVENMIAHDTAEGTSYADTVLALLDHESNVAEAAASLYLHANTFRYRVRRTKDLFGLDLDDPDTRLLVWVILRSARRGSYRSPREERTLPGLSK